VQAAEQAWAFAATSSSTLARAESWSISMRTGGKVHPHGGHTVNAPDLPFDLRHAGRAEKPSERRTVRVVEAAVVLIVLFLRSRTTPSWGGIDDVTQAATGEP